MLESKIKYLSLVFLVLGAMLVSSCSYKQEEKINQESSSRKRNK